MEKLQAKIQEILKNRLHKNCFAVFDFDNTCITNDISEATLAFMTKNNLFRDHSLLPGLKSLPSREFSKKIFKHYHSLLDQKKYQEAYEFNAKMLSGWKVAEIKKLITDVLTFEGKIKQRKNLFNTVASQGITIKPKTIELMKQLQNDKIAIWIVSASSEPLVAETIKRLNIKARLIGIKNVIIDGVITNKIERPVSILKGKVKCIKKYIDPINKPLVAVGDSLNDLPMLEYSEIKIVINRGNELSALAKSKNWFLI
jgi:HAD superfamily phosphoserine phosphatase-like hydrolase